MMHNDKGNDGDREENVTLFIGFYITIFLV